MTNFLLRNIYADIGYNKGSQYQYDVNSDPQFVFEYMCMLSFYLLGLLWEVKGQK